MSSSIGIKAALACLLVGGAILRGSIPNRWAPQAAVEISMIAFGLFNLLVSVPGTFYVRAAAFAGAFVALVAWPNAFWFAVLLAWTLWPPAYMTTWALGRESREVEDANESARRTTPERAAVVAIIGAVAAGEIAYRLFVSHSLQQTAALFIGVPAVIAIVVVLAVHPQSAIGVACKAMTVALLVSALLLQEGFVCIIMSAPLFYTVAIAIGGVMNGLHRRGKATTYSTIALLAIVPALEGVTDITSIRRNETVTVSTMVWAASPDVERALFSTPRFDRTLPLYLRAGFPMAVATRIERAADGMRWVIRVRGGEMYLNGLEPRAGDLVLRLEEARPGLVRWRALSDTSHMTHFLDWQEATVQWEPVTAQTTKVTWTLRYRRGLDPAWYFGPWERYAARLAAGYLIDAVATP